MLAKNARAGLVTRQPFMIVKGVIVGSSCPHTAEESATFIEKRKLDLRIMMKIDRKLPHGWKLCLKREHDMNMKQPAEIINSKQRSVKHVKERNAGSTSTAKK